MGISQIFWPFGSLTFQWGLNLAFLAKLSDERAIPVLVLGIEQFIADQKCLNVVAKSNINRRKEIQRLQRHLGEASGRMPSGIHQVCAAFL